MGPNRFYGTNLWPWLSPGWLGRCTIGFPWSHHHLWVTLETAHANLPLMLAGWVQSAFQWCDYLAMIFVPSLGIEGVIIYIEALTKFT